MLGRSMCIMALILLIGQTLLTGAMPVPTLTPHLLGTPLHPAWLLQDCLVAKIHHATSQPWPFRFRHSIRRRRKRGSGRRLPRACMARVEIVDGEAIQPPQAWPDQMLDLMDQSACRQVIRQARWEQGLVCPYCASSHVEVLYGQLTSAGWQRYACLMCCTPKGYAKTFSDLTGTPWESSHLSPAQLLVSLAIFVEGHSAEELARQLSVQPRIGQRMRRLYQVVLHLNRPETPVDGEIEVDEIYIISGWKGCPAGLKPPRPARRRRLKGKRGRGIWETDKVPLVAIVQRNGQVRLLTQRNLRKATFRPLLRRWISQGAQVYTDDYDIYHFLTSAGYRHQSVCHSQGEYARGQVHVNTTEGLFSLLRPYLATFRGVSKVYLPLYVAAFEFRHNHRHLTNWQQAGVLLRLLCQTDGPTVRQAVRDTTVVELCQLPT